MRRNTLQKQIIIHTLKEMSWHPTASQIYEKLHSHYPSISKATVFRVLNQACQAGVAMQVMVGERETRYEMKNPPHYHMWCRVCGKVEDASMAYHAGLEEELKDRKGFTIEGHTTAFYGICEDCRRQESQGKSKREEKEDEKISV